MIRAIPCLAAAAALVALSACAATDSYPSLARRPAERITGSADVVAPAPAPSPPPALPSGDFSARLAQLTDQARAAHQRFGEKRERAESLIAGAAGSTVGGESWSVANIALADLEAARSDAMVALGELDEIYTAESLKAADTGNTSSADAAKAAHVQVDGWVAEEDAVIDRLRGRLRV